MIELLFDSGEQTELIREHRTGVQLMKERERAVDTFILTQFIITVFANCLHAKKGMIRTKFQLLAAIPETH